mmetsp:Transcript_30692/g.46786  ORF Transcript_30692/g.46786 Transcript_30692/m.46786 type:complete len:2214 (+) Transcript_30692:157-6798(+)
MPRRGSTKRLNISTDQKFEPLGESSNQNEASRHQPQHQSLNTSGPQPLLSASTKAPGSSQIAFSVTGESNDSRGAPPNVAQHRKSPALITNPIASKPRSVQIEALLKHRKLLLQRTRQSKQAAEARLENPSSRSIAAILAEHTADSKTGSYDKGKDAEGKVLSEEDAYKELGRLASQAAKKQRNQDEGVEKRAALSLRRGSTVGKRMTAAISALAPGAAESSVDASTLISAPLKATTPTLPPPQNNSKNAMKKMKKSSSSSANLNVNHLPGGKNVNENNTNSIKKRSIIKSQKAASQLRNPYNYGTSHLIDTAPIKQSVIFPAAIALRERKKLVEETMNAFLVNRKHKMNSQKQNAELESRVLTNNGLESGNFPQRRKTRWDYVMEEMRWLATDFCEERKWKIASTRALSSAVTSHFETSIQEQKLKENNAVEEVNVSPPKCTLNSIVDIDDEKKDADMVLEEEEKSVTKQEDRVTNLAPIKKEDRVTNLTPINYLYSEPSEDDIQLSRLKAKNISEQVTVLWNEISNASLSPELSDASSGKSGDDEISHLTKVSEIQQPRKKQFDIENHTPPLNIRPKVSNETVKRRIDDLLKRVKNRPRQRSSRAKQSSKGVKPILTPVEQNASDFIEFLWKSNNPVGGIFGNALSFSPFDVVCSLIPHNIGPHVILCPSSRVLYWRTELNRICNRVLIAPGEFSQEDIKDLSPTDVVVAEWFSKTRENKLDLSIFESVVLDASFPVYTKKSIVVQEVRSLISTQILSGEWWDSLLMQMLRKKQKRLLISNSFVFGNGEESSLFKFFTEKERLEWLSGMAAFAFGPQNFVSRNRSLISKVLSWAKYAVEKGKVKGKRTVDRIENYLILSLRKVLFSPEGHYGVMQQQFEEKSTVDTEVCLCKMSPTQQMAYDKCCRNIRGAISLGNCVSNAAKALIQLRDVCFHSRLHDVCKTFSSNSSQPDIHNAVEIMKESAKLKKLISLLYRDFGYEVKGLSVLRALFQEFQPKSKRLGKQMKKSLPKIAIIASSPSARRLTSMILSAVGISHECLPRIDRRNSPDNNRENANDSQSWVERQSSLQRYNNTSVDHSGLPIQTKKESLIVRNCNIIIGSAVSMGAQQVNGMSLEASDTLILLDEDWSGRENFLMKNLLFRCYLHRKRQDKERSELRIYRLICDDTCEKKLLCTSNDGDGNLDIETKNWAVGGLGLLELKESFPCGDQSFSHYEPYYLFKFPCLNLLSFANQDLALFLGAKDPLPKTLEAGKRLDFLPFAKSTKNGDEQRKYFLRFAQELCIEEEVKHSGSKLITHATLDGTIIPNFVSLRNIEAAKVRFFIEAYGMHFNYIAKEPSKKIKMVTNSKIIHAPSEKVETNKNSRKVEFNCNNLKQEAHDATSVLFYGASGAETRHKKRKKESIENSEGQQQSNVKSDRRSNAFSVAYTNTTRCVSFTTRDGSLDSEPLVYFPPLFPSLRSIAPKAVEHLSIHLSKSKVAHSKIAVSTQAQPALEVEGIKRSLEMPTRPTEASKRPRLESSEENGAVMLDTKAITSAQLPNPQVDAAVLNVELQQHANGNQTTGGVLPGSSGQLTTTLPIKCEEEKLFDEAKDTLIDLNEDFGILGVGAFPQTSHSFMQAENETVGLSHYHTTRSLHELYLPYNAEEHEHFDNQYTKTSLEMMILFAAKKGIHPMRSTPGLSTHTHTTQWNTPANAISMGQFIGAGGLNGSTAQNSNGSNQVKKGKKKTTTPTPFIVSAPSLPGHMSSDYSNQPPAGLATALSNPKGKDALRHKILAMHGRHSYGTSSLFESSAFRSAFNRVRDRIKEKVSREQTIPSGHVTMQAKRHALTQHWQPMAQHSTNQSWTTIATKCNSERGKQTPQQSVSDRSDFGPFQVGRLVSVTDIVNIPHPKPMLGLSLPMGVKVPGQHIGQAIQPWTPDEDRELHALSIRFGMNWHLVACNLKYSSKYHLRSARLCRERWHNLATVDSTLMAEMEKACADLSSIRKNAPEDDKSAGVTPDVLRMVKKTVEMQTTHDTTTFLSSQLISNTNAFDCLLVGKAKRREESPPLHTGPPPLPGALPQGLPELSEIPHTSPPPVPKTRRQFGALRTAAMKRQDVPMQIPGVVTGQKPSVAAAHPSHHQSLQVAVAALASGGRTDMWPLQILDLADKQRKNIARSQPNVSSGRAPQRPTGSYQTTQPRNAPVQQEYAQASNQARLSAQSQPSSGNNT